MSVGIIGVPRKIKDNSRRRGIPAQKKAQRKLEAESRNRDYALLTNGMRLAKLDEGGFTATKQRAKIMQKIAEGKV